MDNHKQQALWLALLAGTAVALYLSWLTLKPFVGVITWAIVIVVTFYPVHRRMASQIGRPIWAALASTVLVILTILLPVVFVTMMVVKEAPALGQNAQEAVQYAVGPKSPLPEPVVGWARDYINGDKVLSPEDVSGWTQRISEMAMGPLVGVASGFIAGIIALFLMVFAIFYLFKDGEALLTWLEKMLPLESAQSDEILRRTREMIDASVYGVIVLATLQGALGGLAFLVLGLPSPFIWGVVMAILSMIPVTGSFFVWGPAAVYLALTGEWGRAVALAAWGTLVIGTVDNFLRPYVMGQKTKLHELLLFFAVLGGLVAFGVAGVVLGPVILAVTLGLLDVIRLSDRPADAIQKEPGLAEQSAKIPEDHHQMEAESANNSRHTPRMASHRE